MEHRVWMRVCGVSALICCGGAIAGECWRQNPLEFDACTVIGGCDTPGACTTPTVSSEDVKTTSGGHDTGKSARVIVQYSCVMTWKVHDQEGHCNIPRSCNLVTDGSVTSGFQCGGVLPPS